MFMLMSLITFFTMMLMTVKNPFIGSLMLVGLTMLLMLEVSFIMTQWVSYLMMLLFLGGMMVMFLYVTSIMTTLKLNMKLSMKALSLFGFILIFGLFMVDFSVSSVKFISISDLFNFDSYAIIMFVMFYLLLGLVAVVNISKSTKGSLKSKINA